MSALVGRQRELDLISLCLKSGRHILLEGPVGVGKTALAMEAIRQSGLKSFRVDGDSRYSEQKLSGWMDPTQILNRGYSWDIFTPGPLVEAMKSGGVLFLNEMNRLPEGVQNILLPALDEKKIQIPRLGELKAAPGFSVIATQNPREFIATSQVSEALLDRFEWLRIDYPERENEINILKATHPQADPALAAWVVDLVRLTREDSRVRRGASIRAGQAILELSAAFINGEGPEKGNISLALTKAAELALPTRLELEVETVMPGVPSLSALIAEWVQTVLSSQKKKS